jgi:translocation and assembly module TamB
LKRLIIIGLCALPGLALAQSQEDEDKGFIVNLIEDNLSGDARDVTIIGFEGALSSEASIRRLTVADSAGIWLSLEDVTLDWNRSALLRGAIEVEELSAAKITVTRAPLPDDSVELPDAEATPFALPELPVSINLETLQIDEIALGEVFLGEPVTISLTGSASLSGGDGVANVEALRLDERTGRFVIDGSYSNASEVLALDLDLSEDADGIIARLLDLPGKPSVALELDGTGPLSEYAATLSLATDGAERIAGNLALNESDLGQAFAVDIGGDVTPLFAPDYQDFFGPDVQLAATGVALAAGGFDLSELSLSAQNITLDGTLRTDASGFPEMIDITGGIMDAGGAPVLLPLSGDPTFVQSMDLIVTYDRTQSDDWTAAFDIADFEQPGVGIDSLRLNGGGTLLAGETRAVSANFNYGATGLTLDDVGLAEALGDAIRGTLQVNYQDGTPTKIERLTLTGPGIELDATATILGAEDGLRTTSDVNLNVATLSRFATLSGLDLTGAADLNITSTISPLDGFYEIALDGTTTDLGTGIAEVDPLIKGPGTLTLQAARDTAGTRLNNLNIATQAAEITANANITSEATNAAFDVNLVEVGDILNGVGGPADLTGTARQVPGGPLTFDVQGTAPDLALSAQGTLRDDVNLTATSRFRVADLGTYNQLTGQSLSGSANLALDLKAVTDGSSFNATLNGQTVDLQSGIAQLDPLLRGRGTIALNAERTGPEAFALNDLRITTPEARITADGRIRNGATEADFDVTVNNMGLVLDGTQGSANIAGTVNQLPSGALQFDVDGTAPDLALTAQGTLTDNTDLVAAATVTAANLATYNQLTGQNLGGGVTLALDVTAQTDGSLFDVRLDGETQNLQSGIAQLDPLLTGDGTITARAARTGPEAYALNNLRIETPAMQITGAGAGSPTGPLNGTAQIMINDAGTIAPGLSGPMTADLAANRNAAGSTDVDLTATAPGANVVVDAQVSPDMLITGNVRADVASLAPYQRLIGQPVRGGFNGTVTGTLRPDLSELNTEITLRTQNIGIGNPSVDQLLAGDGRLSANVARTETGINIRNLNAQTGNVSLTANLNSTDAGGTGQFNARLRDIGLFTEQLSGPVTATGSADRSGSTWRVDIDATGPGGIGAQVNGTASDSGTLNMRVTGNAPLGLANEILDPRRLSGNATFNMAINGPPALSSVSGRVNVAGARLAAPTLGQSIEDINGFISFAAARADINITGNLQAGGQLAISGPVGLEGPNNADIAVRLGNVILKDPTLYESSVDGTITVRGPLAGGARIAGALELGPSEVQVPSSSLSSLGELPNVVHFGEGAAVRRTLNRADVNATAGTQNTRASAGPAYPLDITINAPSRIFIRGRGLDAELGGSLNLGGTTNNVIPVGQFDLIRGRLDILQQRFELTEGTASLQGDFEPFIRLVASTEASTGTIINIVVEGPASTPEVTFQSTPELPQDEVLSQLIFGRNLSEISPLQAVQLAAAVSTLAGNSGGGLIDDFRQNLGLDDFDVTTDDEGNAAVRAGAYISENVYTDVTVSSDGSTEVNINLDITDEITAKGTVDADGETSIGIFFERDY